MSDNSRRKNDNCIIQVGDGKKSLLRCIALKVYGDEARYNEIRKELVDTIAGDETYYKSIVDGVFQDHIYKMSEKRTWGI